MRRSRISVRSSALSGLICVGSSGNIGRFAFVQAFSGQDNEKPVGGFGQREDLYAGYEAGGRHVERDRIQFWEVFGTLRWGVMCAGMTAMFRGPDHTVERAVIARRTSETEIDLMRLLASA